MTAFLCHPVLPILYTDRKAVLKPSHHWLLQVTWVWASSSHCTQSQHLSSTRHTGARPSFHSSPWHSPSLAKEGCLLQPRPPHLHSTPLGGCHTTTVHTKAGGNRLLSGLALQPATCTRPATQGKPLLLKQPKNVFIINIFLSLNLVINYKTSPKWLFKCLGLTLWKTGYHLISFTPI